MINKKTLKGVLPNLQTIEIFLITFFFIAIKKYKKIRD